MEASHDVREQFTPDGVVASQDRAKVRQAEVLQRVFRIFPLRLGSQPAQGVGQEANPPGEQPGEDRAAFERLLEGVARIRFDRLGAFVFSPEEGTPAATMRDIPSRRTAARRLDRLMRLQAEISAELMARWVRRTVRVLVESCDEAAGQYVGRTMRDAPEVDGVVKFTSRRPLSIGSFAQVRITGAETYDLIGEAAGREGKREK